MSPIKTIDLCARCEYGVRNKRCDERDVCGECENLSKEKMCLCTMIVNNTPCPYFKEASDKGG